MHVILMLIVTIFTQSTRVHVIRASKAMGIRARVSLKKKQQIFEEVLENVRQVFVALFFCYFFCISCFRHSNNNHNMFLQVVFIVMVY